MDEVIRFPRRNVRDPLPMSDVNAAESFGRLYECNDLLAAIKSRQITTMESLEDVLEERLQLMKAHFERVSIDIPHCTCGTLTSTPCNECFGGVRAYFKPE